ncbi:protein kinase [Variovorax sp. J2P1-59]|uniref:serine/threonine-protein kinase n=1 Tax=Variovorax flavidus TaxID=3053501 RepID=UPI0025760A13|nr:serine/threonine-protein kinase [Variovorax sp. J2P1-59]MDM0077449.1 protein kinase [Variovorax sp. J2P1-59]
MTIRFFVPRADRRLGDRYELVECLGDGSYGWVWRAQRLSDGAIVAVKIPKAQGKRNEELAEGSPLVGQLSHPSVVDVHWMGRVPPEREWYAIEMEYFPSITLAQLLDKGEEGFVASYDKLLGVFEQVLDGCAHLHRVGMSHGDIKPQNILVAADRVKLTDFGSSVLPEDMYARTRENGGTILYSAPEVVGSTLATRDKSARFLCDIYSLGVLLYHLVTARLPHDTLSQVARHVPFARAREVNSSVAQPLDEFIDRCLRLVPEERWPTVDVMLETFRGVRRAQVQSTPTRALGTTPTPQEDWSTLAVRLVEKGDFRDAELIARAEFESSRDEQAFLLMVHASYQEGRYFDCIRDLESRPDMVDAPSTMGAELRRLALSAYLEIRQVDRAGSFAAKCLADTPEAPDLLLKRASILALDAKYEAAAEELMALHRRLPGRPAILRRLVAVFEQMRDVGKAAAFLRAYQKLAPDDPWAAKKAEQYRAIGLA